MSWETVIGLEVHVQLATRSKLFCGCSTRFGDPPNTNVCPVCLGLPGALPVPNADAVRLAVRAAIALACTVHEVSVFARKNYFYPDLPKGYQISQFDRPLATKGRVALDGDAPQEIGITRLHMEEDAGKSLHDQFPGLTAIDFNRTGVPLIEIVTEPDLRSPEDARRLLTTLKQVLEYVEVSDCNMEEGSLRVDANLSVRQRGSPLGTKQEVKNMNSFAAVERALAELRDLQIATLERGEAVTLTTYSAGAGTLRPMRSKEESHDYRYFPDPDLPPLDLARYGITTRVERETLPELPSAKQERFRATYGLSAYEAGVLAATRPLAGYYEAVVAGGADPKTAANWVMGPLLADAKQSGGAYRVAAPRMVEIIALVTDGTLSNQAAKRVFGAVAEDDAEPLATARALGLVQVGDRETVIGWVNDVVSAHPDEAERYRTGEARLFGFFMGEIMKRSGGKADPNVVQQVLRDRLG